MGNSVYSEQAHDACRTKNIYKFSSLLKDAPDGQEVLDSRGEGNMTPLMTASTVVGNHDLVVFLLSKGAKMDLVDKNGWTAMHHAASIAELDIIKVLIENGAKKYLRNNLGLTPMDFFLDQQKLKVFELSESKESDEGPSVLVPSYVVHGAQFSVEYAWGSLASGAYLQIYTQSMKCLWKIVPRIGHFKYIQRQSSTPEKGEGNASAIGSISFSSDLLKTGKYYRVLLHLSSSKAIASSKPFKVVQDDSNDDPNFDYEFSLEEEGIEDY